jgi:hypothetical protein
VRLFKSAHQAGTDRSIVDTVTMQFINLFLVGYAVAVLGVAIGLWQAGVLTRIAPVWIGVGALVAIGVGVMMAVSSGKPTSRAQP